MKKLTVGLMLMFLMFPAWGQTDEEPAPSPPPQEETAAAPSPENPSLTLAPPEERLAAATPFFGAIPPVTVSRNVSAEWRRPLRLMAGPGGMFSNIPGGSSLGANVAAALYFDNLPVLSSPNRLFGAAASAFFGVPLSFLPSLPSEEIAISPSVTSSLLLGPALALRRGRFLVPLSLGLHINAMINGGTTIGVGPGASAGIDFSINERLYSFFRVQAAYKPLLFVGAYAGVGMMFNTRKKAASFSPSFPRPPLVAPAPPAFPESPETPAPLASPALPAPLVPPSPPVPPAPPLPLSTGPRIYQKDRSQPVYVHSGLEDALNWFSWNAEDGGAYIIELAEDEPDCAGFTLDADFVGWKRGVLVTLEGFESVKTITLSRNGSLFTIGEGNGGGMYPSITLVIGKNIRLVGRESNTEALVTVRDGGTFVLEDGEITGNAVSGSVRGSGVVVSGGSFIMKGGKIAGNMAYTGQSYASSGAGVYVREDGIFMMTGGEIADNTIYGKGTMAGVFAENWDTVALMDGAFNNNIAGYGGDGADIPLPIPKEVQDALALLEIADMFPTVTLAEAAAEFRQEMEETMPAALSMVARALTAVSRTGKPLWYPPMLRKNLLLSRRK